MTTMCSIPPLELLTSWEHGLGRPHPARALVLLRLARPDEPEESLVRLSMGQRDDSLMDLHARLFGERITAVATCSACGEELELDFHLPDVRLPQPETDHPLTVEARSHLIRFRLPDTRDMLAVLHPGDIPATRWALLKRSVIDVHRGDRPVPLDEVPADVIAILEARMGEIDPQADIRLAPTCPACSQTTEIGFDIVSYLWSELHTWACRTLYDVHALASAYSWSEIDILTMSAARRRFYLEALGS